jgi:hypothetical protein
LVTFGETMALVTSGPPDHATTAGRPAAARLDTAVRRGAAPGQASGDWEGPPTRADLAAPSRADPVVR